MTAKEYQKLRIMRIRAVHAAAIADRTPVDDIKPTGKGIRFEVLHEKEPRESITIIKGRKKLKGTAEERKKIAEKNREQRYSSHREAIDRAKRLLRKHFANDWFYQIDALLCLGIGRHKWLKIIVPALKLEVRRMKSAHGPARTQYRRKA